MKVIEVVEKYLRENGFDGLFNDECDCACEVGDLEPCCALGDCRAGYRVPCDCGDHDYHIVPEKPEEVLEC